MSEEGSKEYLDWCMKNQNHKEKVDETFQKDGDTFYNWISDKKIREIIREEIILYNETFMTALTKEKNVTEN